MFLSTHQDASPESFSQLFTSTTATQLAPDPVPRPAHTHAPLIVAADVPIKAVAQRLGHAHPGFTMHTSQRLLPGTYAPQLVAQFSTLIDTNL